MWSVRGPCIVGAWGKLLYSLPLLPAWPCLFEQKFLVYFNTNINNMLNINSFTQCWPIFFHNTCDQSNVVQKMVKSVGFSLPSCWRGVCVDRMATTPFVKYISSQVPRTNTPLSIATQLIWEHILFLTLDSWS
jgi:hypothetical protein